jgi:hypothetical protein
MVKQQLLSSMFSNISKVDMEESVEQEFVTLGAQIELERSMKKEVVKHAVGRPKKTLEAVLTKRVIPQTSSSKKVRGPYTNWFVPSLWDPIYAAVNKHRNLKSALHYLQLKYKLHGQETSVYDRLSRGSLAKWFTSVGELKEGTKQAIFKETAAFTGDLQHAYVLSNYHELEEDIITILKQHRDARKPLFASIIRGLIRSMIQKKAPHLLDHQSKSGFNVSIPWTRDLVRTNLGWSFKKATGAARKLPNNWMEQGEKMTQRAAYLMKAHSIPPTMFVNTDQTGIHLVSFGGARTWTKKGSKHVLVHGMDDKRQITCLVSSSAAGNLLPFQLIFTGTTDRCLPPRNIGRQECEDESWHLTYSNNHWSNLQTCKDFVIHILEPYRQKQAKEMGLEKDAKLIWLLDCWSVHMSKDFTSWVKEKYPQILLIFVPANCTSVLQPANVIIQRPFKHSFKLQFDTYTSQDIGHQLEEKDLKDVKLDTKMTVLKPLLCSWLYQAW